jgi:hypothetical protein
MKKEKTALKIIAAVYTVAMIFATLYVPVKAVIGNGQDIHTELGYYTLWDVLSQSSPSSHPGKDTGAESRMVVTLNITAWIIQYIFITAVFGSMYYRVRRHFRSTKFEIRNSKQI